MAPEYPPRGVTAHEDETRRGQILRITQQIRAKLLSYTHLYVDSPEKELPPEEDDSLDEVMEAPETFERFYVSEDPEQIIDEAEDLREIQLRESVSKLAKLTAGLGFAKLVSAYVDLGAIPQVEQRALDMMMNLPTLGGAAVAAVLMVMRYREADAVFGSTDRNDPEAVAALLRKI